ncbi:hypothetical protein B0A49_00070 [Cryomyces minteri]|uniref:Uncharacterized protein n=1 Tax=Cryomyces minteri TaxID=331657 RepID=A0A4V5NIA2_9PEZI|nr:hypothetical protein B0A49_00070 [Cryomyces minteri]
MASATTPVPGTPAIADAFVVPVPRHDHSLPPVSSAPPSTSPAPGVPRGHATKPSAKWRHTIGILLLLTTVVLWTASNFLASTIFAGFKNDTYSKPYFVTYINTAFFVVLLIPLSIRRAYKDPAPLSSLKELWKRRSWQYKRLGGKDIEDDALLETDNRGHRPRRSSSTISEELLVEDELGSPQLSTKEAEGGMAGPLSLRETAKLSLEFCMLWFLANYSTAACLEYTTVASSTILTSTSSIWTLIFGALLHVERFTYRKLLGVLASLAGIILISSVDLSGSNDANRGSFPHKSRRQIAVGDALAFSSAVLYGIYTVLMKKRIGDEARVDMPLFFGLVGLFNVVLLWPGLLVLHWTGVEPFELPPTGKVLTIVLVNSLSSLISDFCWAYAMLLTSPLIVTVGLSMTIPLSLVGQIVLNGQTASAAYWLGAGVVLCSFLFVNHESGAGEADGKGKGTGREGARAR